MMNSLATEWTWAKVFTSRHALLRSNETPLLHSEEGFFPNQTSKFA